MTNEALHELAERVEAAEGGETDLDKAIAEALGWRLVVLQRDDGVSDYDWKSPSGEFHPWYPFFTRSIDAALTLTDAARALGVLHEAAQRLTFAGYDPANCLDKLARFVTAAALRALATKDPTP